MNYDYQNVLELFGLETPVPLPKDQIEKIRGIFGGIPKALEDYYRTCGGCIDMNSAQDFLVTPDGIYYYRTENFDYDDYCVFYAENQCVSEWAVKKSDLNLENPPVYESYGGETWEKTDDSLYQSLVSHAYLQGAFSLEYSSEEFYEADTEQVSKIAEKFSHISADSSLYTGVKFFLPYPDTVIAVLNNDDDSYLIIYSSRTEQHFSETDSIISEILGFEKE